jgi:hypothetical protein
MKVGASRSQLDDAQQTARAHWDQSGETWNDPVRTEFAERVWIPLDERVSAVLQAVDQLTALFTQIRTDCEFQP